MVIKLVISDPKSGLSIQKEANDDASKGFMGLKIGDTVKGEIVDLHGYEFALMGGSDYCGFPMRKDVAGVGRKKILAYRGTGIRKAMKGIIQRKTVCGNTVHSKISQINLKVTKMGTDNIFANAGKKKESVEDKAEGVKAKKPAKEVKDDPIVAKPGKKEAAPAKAKDQKTAVKESPKPASK